MSKFAVEVEETVVNEYEFAVDENEWNKKYKEKSVRDVLFGLYSGDIFKMVKENSDVMSSLYDVEYKIDVIDVDTEKTTLKEM